MNELREKIIKILAYRCEETARKWAAQCTASRAGLTVAEELAEINVFMFRLLSKLPDVPHREMGCLSGNYDNPDHWLRDFANVVSPLLVLHKTALFDAPAPSPSRTSLDELIGRGLTNPMIVY